MIYRPKWAAGWRLRSLLAVGAVSLIVLAVAGQASALKYYSKTKAVPSTPPTLGGRGEVQASCPKSHPQVTGGGVRITGDNSNFDLEVAGTKPSGARNGGWSGEVNNSSGSTAQMTTTAICARGRYRYPARSKLISPGVQATKKVSCPSGTKLTGGGVTTEGSSPRMEVAASKPFDGPDGNRTPDDGWLGSANNGTSSERTMSTFAVCSFSGHYRYLQSHPKSFPDNSTASTHVTCPAGTSVTGGGIANSGTEIGAEMESTFPFPNRYWGGLANNDNIGQNETIQAFAICKV
jgi:hypothetical protein